MKFKYLLLQLTVLSILFCQCQKDDLKNNIKFTQEKDFSDSINNIYACNDIATRKSYVDLKILSYINTCYLCQSVKTVPGLGSINWTANCATTYNVDSLLKIEVITYLKESNQFFSREKILFLNVPRKVGLYKLNNTTKINNERVPYSSYFRLEADGDLLDASWKIDTLCLNYIDIQQINLDDKYISGEFEIHLLITPNINFTYYSDRINFTKSKFQSNILF